MLSSSRLLCLIAFLGVLVARPVFAWKELSSERIETVAGWLAPQPAGYGPPCSERAAWSAQAGRLGEVRKAADKLLTQDFPPWDEEAYLDYSRNGQRPRGERMMNARKAWLYPLVLAECGEYAGRYLPAIERALDGLLSQPTWTWAAHDKDLRNLRQRKYEVDLLAADTAFDLAQTLYLLEARLQPATRERLRAALEKRVFAPLRASFANGADHWWLQADHNWNAVCLSGVVGAALTVLPDPRDRALFAAAGEHYIRKYLAGFGADGYSSEGPGYWNYGFSHFVMLRARLLVATSGRLDLFEAPRVASVARYGFGIEMLPGNIAAFGDASPTTRIDEWTRAYLSDAFAPGVAARFAALPLGASQRPNDTPLASAVATLFLPVVPAPQRLDDLAGGSPRTYFDQAGVLVARPAAGGRLAVSIKAGGNGNHSHNDLGSYVVALGAEQPTGDPGMTVYSAKTFSKERYTIRGINSWGHPLPVVDGALQKEATKVRARVTATRFATEADEIALDLAPAYANGIVRELTRTLRFERTGAGRVAIEDRFAYLRDGAFETALITRGEWQRQADGTLVLWQRKERLLARVEASADYVLEAETVDEEGLRFTRVAIRLREPQREGFVRVSFEPE